MTEDFEYFEAGVLDVRYVKCLKLVRECYACPESYRVYEGDEQIAYLRLRHGTFSAWVKDYSGKCVYYGKPKGDGIFCEDERDFYLNEAVEAILPSK